MLADWVRWLKLGALGLLLLAPGVAAAVSSPVVSGGLADAYACTAPNLFCEPGANFNLDPPLPIKPVSGSIDFNPTQAGATSVDIALGGLAFTLTGSSGTVARIDFSNVSLSVLGMPVTAGPGVGFDIEVDGSVVTGSISGTYEQRNGVGGVVVAAQPFSDLSVSIDNFACLLTFGGVGTCGFDVGLSTRFDLDVNGTPHWVGLTYNVVVPEPATAAMLALGLLGLALHRRR